jgi:hypothetical protein
MIGRFNPEDFTKMQRLIMRRKKLASAPIDWINSILSSVISSDGTSIAPGALPDLAGDVTGPPGTNTVVKMQNIAVSTTDPTTGQVLKYDGSQWAPGADSVGSALTVQELDGSPLDSAVTIIRVTNGKLIDNGVGDVTLDLSGGAPVDATYVVRTANATLTNEVLLSTVLASELQTRYEPLTNGDPDAPELIFAGGDVVMAEVLN